jgi:predicted Kef-type K+ transport protein
VTPFTTGIYIYIYILAVLEYAGLCMLVLEPSLPAVYVAISLAKTSCGSQFMLLQFVCTAKFTAGALGLLLLQFALGMFFLLQGRHVERC